MFPKSIEHAAKYTTISEEQKEVLLHTCKSLLYHKGEPWQKKGTGLFDITMGGFAGAEKCDLVGLYLLSLLEPLPMEVGLFRDDGAALSRLTKKENEKLKQEIIKIFKKEGLDITINVNFKVIEFLDVECCLNTGTYKPFTKPNNTILYIDVMSIATTQVA